MREQLTWAASEEAYQTVGHLGREVMISLAQAVIDPSEAIGDDGRRPSSTDAGRLLEAYMSTRCLAAVTRPYGRAVRAVVQATSAVLHDRNATRKDATLAAELVSSSVHLVHILATHP